MACSGSWKNMQRVPGSSAGEGGWLELALEGQASPDDMRSLEEVDHFSVAVAAVENVFGEREAGDNTGCGLV